MTDTSQEPDGAEPTPGSAPAPEPEAIAARPVAIPAHAPADLAPVSGSSFAPEPEVIIPGPAPAPPDIRQPEATGFGLRLHPELTGDVPKNHLIMALISVMTCTIFGAIAIYYSMRVERLWMLGEHEKSRSASKAALTWAILGDVLGVLTLGAAAVCYVWVLFTSPGRLLR